MPNAISSLDTIFSEAIELPDAAQRADYLARACGSDVPLRHRVEALVEAHFRAGGSFLEQPVPSADSTAAFVHAADDTPAPEVGTTIGPFTLREQIGEGGMGLVFVAEQMQPVRRKVALKLIKPGMDSRQVVARFEAERQALALMDHPNIAKVLDAGTTPEGRPYFVMELVKGEPVTDYCDRNRLNLRQRLELFLQVCQAVQHAHQKGVIHRDLKPSNILIAVHDVTPVAKVIDFGIAKAVGQSLTDKTVYTAIAQFVGTPLYMSPEQAGQSSLDVDTRTDVYALGVLLYELLTGTTPIDPETVRKAGLDEVRRIIREDEPPRPSARMSTLKAAALSTVAEKRAADPRRLARQVRGELDWVVMKCLEKDRNRRYESASALAADVQRYLSDEPVAACPPSVGYRVKKLARRNKAAVVTTALVAAAVTLGSAASVWKYLDERAARRDADAHRADAERHATEARRQTDEAVRAQNDAHRARQEAERQRNAVYRNLYVADIRLGPADWESGNVDRLLRKLADHAPAPDREDVRGWEWYYHLALCHQDERTLLDHRASVKAVAWSPDGRYVASTGDDGATLVWDAVTWRLVRIFHRGTTLKKGLAWSPDGRWLAWGAVADDNAVYLWRVGTDEVKALRGHTSSVWTVAWHPGGKRLASAGIDATVRVWDVESGDSERVIPDQGGNSDSVAWSPDGSRLVSANQGAGLRVWETQSWKVVHEGAHKGQARVVAWGPDGTRLAVGSVAGECVVHRTTDWSEVGRWPCHRGGVIGMAWSPDGSRLATCGADTLVKVWSPAGTLDRAFRGHRNAVNAVGWEPGGRRVVSASMDSTVKVWSMAAIDQPRRLDVRPGASLAIRWGADRNAVLALDPADGAVTTWDVVTGRRGRVALPAGRFGDVAPGGGRVAVAQGLKDPYRVVVCDANTGQVVHTVDTTLAGPLCFSPDATHLAMGIWNRVEVIDLRRNEIGFRLNGSWFRDLAWSPDGRVLAIAGAGEESDGGALQWAGWVHVFDVGQRKRVSKLRHGAERVKATAVTWSPDGKRLASGDENGLVEIREMPDGRKLVAARPHTGSVTALAWSPDGRRVASASLDGTVRLWDSDVGEDLLRFDTPVGNVMQLRWSADGQRLAAATDAGAVLIWDAAPGFAYQKGEQYAREQARVRIAAADQLWANGRREEAVALLHPAQESLTRLLGPDHLEVLTLTTKLADGLMVLGRFDEAIRLLEPTLEKLRGVLATDSSVTAAAMTVLARAYEEKGRLDASERLWREVLISTLKDEPKSALAASPMASLGLNLLKQKRFTDAEPLLRECLSIREAKISDDWLRFNAMSLLGEALLGQGKYAEAEPVLIQGYEGMKAREARIPSDARHRLGEAGERVVRLYDATSRLELAREWRLRLPAPKP